jgi:hypothetical protein
MTAQIVSLADYVARKTQPTQVAPLFRYTDCDTCNTARDNGMGDTYLCAHCEDAARAQDENERHRPAGAPASWDHNSYLCKQCGEWDTPAQYCACYCPHCDGYANNGYCNCNS